MWGKESYILTKIVFDDVLIIPFESSEGFCQVDLLHHHQLIKSCQIFQASRTIWYFSRRCNPVIWFLWAGKTMSEHFLVEFLFHMKYKMLMFVKLELTAKSGQLLRLTDDWTGWIDSIWIRRYWLKITQSLHENRTQTKVWKVEAYILSWRCDITRIICHDILFTVLTGFFFWFYNGKCH